ncbi:MAG: sulfite exporter TauE/SafE family protein [SAR324 cluster bacterium]|nr:sulfite exporter TauE/SafE family protein [SAR324 cluster bacterium]
MITWEYALLLLAVGVIAGFVNTLAGGGSMLTLPVLMLSGMPADLANATNRVSIWGQSAFGAMRFHQHQQLDVSAIIPVLIPTASGSLIGALLASFLPLTFLKPALLIVMIFMALIMVIMPSVLEPGLDEIPFTLKQKPAGNVALFLSGIYGGFVQAGVGYILLFSLTGILRYHLVKANALKMTATLIFSTIALVVFIWRDQVLWIPGLILCVGAIVGVQASVWFALKAHQKTLKWILLVMIFMTCLGAFFKK